MLLLIISILILVFAGLILADNDNNFGGVIVGLLGITFFCIALAVPGPIDYVKIVSKDPLIVVNSYYVDPSNQYVTVSNKRGTVSSGFKNGLKADFVKSAPILVTEEVHHKRDIWHLNKDTSTDTYLEVPEGDSK